METKKQLLLCFIIILSLEALVLFSIHQYRLYDKQTQDPVSLIVATDMHVLAKDYTGDYFSTPLAMFDGKLTHYSNEYFDAFLSEVIEQKPQFLILSGDLTLNGSVKSHEEIIARLQKVQEAGIEVLVIPGNHDVHCTAGDYSTAEPQIVESMSSQGFMDYYEAFGPKQALSRDTASFSYIYEAGPYLRIVMLDTNTALKGQVHDDTLKWLEKELQAAKFSGADVIAVSHQNLYIHNPLLYFTYQLYNADELLALYEKYDVDINISGHIHVQSIVDDIVPEVVVSSLAVPDTQYSKLLYDGKNITYTTHSTDVSAYALAQGWTNENLLHYKEYCRYYFEQVAKEQTYTSYADSTLSLEEIEVLAETFAQINSAYFAGEIIEESNFKEGLALWRAQEESFVQQYIETMLDETTTDNRSLTLSVD